MGDDGDKGLLREAFELKDAEQAKGLYRRWADTYDEELAGAGYRAPALVVDALLKAGVRSNDSVLDIGCGTGLVGAELKAAGFTTFDGLDFSGEMIAVAEERGVYRGLYQADFFANGMPSAAYAAAVSAGAFTVSGHIGPAGFDEALRLVGVGGVIAVCGNAKAYEQMDFAGKLRGMERAGLASIEALRDVDQLAGEVGRMAVLRKLG